MNHYPGWKFKEICDVVQDYVLSCVLFKLMTNIDIPGVPEKVYPDTTLTGMCHII